MKKAYYVYLLTVTIAFAYFSVNAQMSKTKENKQEVKTTEEFSCK